MAMIYDQDKAYSKHIRLRDKTIRKIHKGHSDLESLIAVDVGANGSVIYVLPGTARHFTLDGTKPARLVEYKGLKTAREACFELSKQQPLNGGACEVMWISQKRAYSDDAGLESGAYLGQIRQVDNPGMVLASRHHYTIFAEIDVIQGPAAVGTVVRVPLKSVWICPTRAHYEELVARVRAKEASAQALEDFRGQLVTFHSYVEASSKDPGATGGEVTQKVLYDVSRKQKRKSLRGLVKSPPKQIKAKAKRVPPPR